MARKTKTFNNYPFDYHHELEVEIESLSNLGDGVVKIPVDPKEEGEEKRSWVIFVPFALPQEKVRIKIWKNDKNCSYADLEEVLEASPHRIEPECKYFGECGGCQYQHVSYDRQLEWKRQQVAELLNHMAGVNHTVNDPLSSPQQWNYRSKITPHFQKPKNGKIRDIGFLKKGTRQALVDIEQCKIAMDSINFALPHIREGAHQRASSYKKGATLLLRANEERVFDNPREIMSEKVGDLTFNFLAGDFFQNNPTLTREAL